MYIHRSMIAAFAAATMFGVMLIYFSKLKPRILKIGLIIFLVTLFIAAGIFDFCFNAVAEKIYTSESIISAKATPLETIRGGYYLVLDGDNYKYLCVGDINTKTIGSDSCEETFSKETEPQIVKKEVTKTYYKEWLWFYSDSMGEDAIIYQFILPDENSILDTNDLERASAEP